ncbi:hypothetical protein FHG87_008185 [Trinorchestia longiramus]|nr:hypothetical protein FHG87_008185 [Trinorchestia longiramus]
MLLERLGRSKAAVESDLERGSESPGTARVTSRIRKARPTRALLLLALVLCATVLMNSHLIFCVIHDQRFSELCIELTVIALGGYFASIDTPGSRKESAPSGGKFAASGGKFSASGGKFSASGGKFSASGGTFTASGAKFAASGAKFAASGAKFAASGAKFAASGDKYAASGAKFAASGGKYAASGGKYAASGGKYAASGGKFTPQPHSGFKHIA